eukprot:7382320-Prymnesium_polylepis.1
MEEGLWELEEEVVSAFSGGEAVSKPRSQEHTPISTIPGAGRGPAHLFCATAVSSLRALARHMKRFGSRRQ